MTNSTTGSTLETFTRILGRVAVLVAVLALYQGIDSGSLIPSDDAIYTRAAIEGARAGRLLDVTWMGNVLFEKGPILFGAIQLCGLFGGPVEAQARFPGLIAGVLILLLIYRIGRDLGLSKPAAMISAAFCLSTNLFFFNARRPMTDLPGLMFALAGFRTFLVSRKPVNGVIAGLLFGLSSLCKLTAPVPFLVAAVVVRLVCRRPDADATDMTTARTSAWCLVGLLAAFIPWHAAMTAVHGMDFVRTYFGFHLFHRMSETIVGNGGAETYVGWIFQRDRAAAIVALPAAIVAILLAVKRDRTATAALVLLACAALPPALSSTALPHYIVPVIPGIALMVGLGADRILGFVGDRTVPSVVTAAVMIAGTTAMFVVANRGDMTRPDYSHDSKALCEIMRYDGSAARIAGTFDLHDTAVPLYCDMQMKFFGHNEGYIAAVRNIPMLSGTFATIDERGLRDMADTGEFLVCDRTGRRDLQEMAGRAGLSVGVREFGERFAVSFQRR